MIAQIVRFKTGLSREKVLEKTEERAPRYRALKGLKQKYYLSFPDTGEYGAVYLWESEAAMKEFLASDLGRTIATAYEIQGEANVRMAEVAKLLRPE
jgi:heme-degrading monooxygenase HmoA